MLNKRQTDLFKLIVEDYIKTAKPVGSVSLCELLKCSSATVRNEMVVLEEAGLIEKTHISSGRIPSEKGYRYYVDNIMQPKELTGEDVLALQRILDNKSLVIDDYIMKSVEIVSEMTSLTAVILGKSSSLNRISKVEVVPITNDSLIAVVITDKGHVEHRNLIIKDIDLNEIKKTVDLINKRIIGVPIEDVSKVLELEIKPVIGSFVKQHEMVYSAFYNALTDFTKESNFQMKNQKNILMQPEFNNTEKIRDIISKFEDKTLIEKIEEEENGINVYIGSENEFDDDVTIIKTKYQVNGEEGTIALIGPKRMEYDKVVTLLEYLKNNIEED